MRLGIATCAKCPDLTATERPLLSLLKHYRIDASPVVWNDTSVDWTLYDALLIRSIWDYHHYHHDFLAWLKLLDQQDTLVWNPTQVLRWNSHKFYLRDLSHRGVEIVPTMFFHKGSASARDEALAKGWNEVVAKPAVSASGYRTHALPLDDQKSIAVMQELASHGDFLVQPFISAVRTSGEVSMTFFDNKYSHAVLKRPREGEFRVQAEHGGKEVAYTPPLDIIKTGEEILLKTGMPVLYARVDGVVEDGRLLLMELELIEPDLFLGFQPGSEAVFASCVANRLKPLASS